MGEQTPKDFVIHHIEKFAVGLVALIVLVYLVMLAAGTSTAHSLSSESDDLIGKVRDAEKNPELPEKIEVDYPEQVKSAFIDIPPAGREPSWFSFKRPYVLRRAEFTFPQQPVHDKPLLRIEEFRVGKVVVSWAPSENNQNIEITGYTLSRKEGKDGRWMERERFKPDVTKFEDDRVRPRTAYSYRVTSHAKATESGVPFTDTELLSSPQEAVIPFNLEFDIEGMMPGVDMAGKRFIRTKVTIIKSDGSKESESKKIVIGEKIKVNKIETDWTLKDFEDRKSILLVNSSKKEVRIPEEKPKEPTPPEPPDESDEPGDDEEEEESEAPKEPPKPPKDPGGGGWLPGDGK
jgi:hypothetical protein